jgi:hypothetical protein
MRVQAVVHGGELSNDAIQFRRVSLRITHDTGHGWELVSDTKLLWRGGGGGEEYARENAGAERLGNKNTKDGKRDCPRRRLVAPPLKTIPTCEGELYFFYAWYKLPSKPL